MRHCLAIVCLSLAPIPLHAQTLELARAGGTLGRPLTTTLHGPASKAFLLVPSLQPGPLPLKAIDGKDTRSLEVGIDLAALLVVGVLPATRLDVPWPLPTDPSLSGQQLHFQAVTFPGSSTFADLVSNPVRSTMGTVDTWVGRGTMLSEARALPGGPAPLPGGGWLLAGGGSGSLLTPRGLASSDLYDPLRQRFDKGPNMSVARVLHRSVALPDGRVLVIGGVDATGAVLRTCEVYDPVARRFVTTGSLRTARAGHTANLLANGKVLATGGTSSFADVASAILGASSTTEIWDPATGQWTNGPSMSRVRLAHISVPLANGDVLVSGGLSLTFVIPVTTSTCEVYRASSNSFAGTGGMPEPRCAHELTRLADGKVLATGGATLSGIDLVANTSLGALFDPAAGTWSTAGTMFGGRALHAAVLLANGMVLAVGGAEGSLTTPKAVARCELFDPVTRRFSLAPGLATGRAAPSVLVLPEGQILAAGGGGGTQNQALATGEMLFR